MQTQPATAPTTPTVHTCHICGRPAYVTLSHVTGGRQYVYAWCVTCGHGQYQAAI